MKKKINEFLEVYNAADMNLMPGLLAFYFIMALVPALTLITYVISILPISEDLLTKVFSSNISNTIMNVVMPSINTSAGLSFSSILALIVSIYICSNGMNSVIIAADNIYGIKYKSFLERRIKAIIMVLFVIVLFLFILIVPVFGNFIIKFLIKITGNNSIYSYIKIFKTPFSWFVIFLFIKLIYTIAPDKQIPSVDVNKGALFTSIGWIIVTYVYMYYALNIANYTAIYSGLATIAMLMIWLYLLAYIFVLGLAINYKKESNIKK